MRDVFNRGGIRLDEKMPTDYRRSVSPVELHIFYEDLVRTLRERGVLCAITSGLACVHYGIAETTQDCDLLCHPSSFGALLDFLDGTRIEEAACHYRVT